MIKNIEVNSSSRLTPFRYLLALLWTLPLAAIYLYFHPDLCLSALYFWPLLILIAIGVVALPAMLAWKFRASPGIAVISIFSIWGALFIFAITGSSSEQMLARCSNATFAISILITATLFGRKLLNLFNFNELRPSQRLVLSSLMGFGAISLLVLFFGLIGWLAFWPIVFLLVIIFLIGIWSIKEVFIDLKETIQKLGSLDGAELVLCATILFALWMSLPSVFLPPLDYDVTEYHAQLPREYVKMGRIAFRPQNAFSGMPQNMEMLTSMVFAIQGTRGWAAAKFLHWLFLPLLLFEVMLLTLKFVGKERDGPKAALAAGLILFLSPLTSTISGLLYVEIGMCAYGAAAALLMLEAVTSNNNSFTRRHALAVGVFAGFAAGAKYPGLLFFALPIVFLLLSFYLTRKIASNGISTRPWRKAAITIVFICLGIVITFGPWMAKNFAETGNPVYPIWNQAFGVDNWDETLEKRFVIAHRAGDNSPAAAREAAKLIFSGHTLMPLGFIFAGLCFLPAGVRIFAGKPAQNKLLAESIQPRIASSWLMITWAGIIVLLWFFFTHRLERFLYPVLVFTSVLGGLGWLRLSKITGKAIALVPLLFFFLLITTAISIAVYLFPPAGGQGAPTGLELAWGKKDPKVMLSFTSSWKTGQAIIRWVPAGRVLLVGEAAGYWLPVNADGAVVFSRHPLEEMLRNSQTPEELAKAIHSRGYTHIAISWSELARLHATYYKAWHFTEAEQQLLRSFFAQYAQRTIPVEFWREWPGGPRELLPFAAEDWASYKLHFREASRLNSSSTASPGPAYLRARPWLAVTSVVKGQKPTTDLLRLDLLWRDYSILLAPDPDGGPPPLGLYPNEIIELRKID